MSQAFDFARSFDTLRAENETSWLEQVYLSPRQFGQMTEAHSILVMGDEGSGKTALEYRLKEYAAQRSGLVTASWRPHLPENAASSDDVVNAFLTQALDSLSYAFLKTFVLEPALYSSAPSWTRGFMLWFIQKYLQGDREYHLSRLAEKSTPEGVETVSHILSEPARSLFPESTPASILPKLNENVIKLGLSGIWIFVDGLDTLHRVSPDRLVQALEQFLSTLGLFEESSFGFKIIVSNELGKQIQKARGILTRRFITYQLKWREDELRQLVDKRLSLALKKEEAALQKLCKDENWLEWFSRYAGDSPRGWLELTRPMLTAFLEKGRSITKTEWREIYRQSPPRLHLDIEAGRVFIGGGEVPVLGIGYQLLRYLYENRDRSCAKAELYERVYKDFYKTHLSTKKKNEERNTRIDWEGMIDTALYRLRQTLEWDKREDAEPIYIISERGKGQIHLENVA
jgi:hypothetical protein